MADKTFEEAMSELEKIVTNLEKENVKLDDAIKEFGKGVELSGYCNKILEEAEKKITVLTEKTDGTIEEENF